MNQINPGEDKSKQALLSNSKPILTDAKTNISINSITFEDQHVWIDQNKAPYLYTSFDPESGNLYLLHRKFRERLIMKNETKEDILNLSYGHNLPGWKIRDLQALGMKHAHPFSCFYAENEKSLYKIVQMSPAFEFFHSKKLTEEEKVAIVHQYKYYAKGRYSKKHQMYFIEEFNKESRQMEPDFNIFCLKGLWTTSMASKNNRFSLADKLFQGKYFPTGDYTFLNLVDKKFVSYAFLAPQQSEENRWQPKDPFFAYWISNNKDLIFRTDAKKLKFFDTERNQLEELFSDPKKGFKGALKMKTIKDEPNSENKLTFTETRGGQFHLLVERVASARHDSSISKFIGYFDIKAQLDNESGYKGLSTSEYLKSLYVEDTIVWRCEFNRIFLIKRSEFFIKEGRRGKKIESYN